MKHPKQLPRVVAMILVSSTALLYLSVAPNADTYETATIQSPLRNRIEQSNPKPIIVELREPTERDAWEKFEAEFGAAREVTPPHLAPLSETKYHIDLTIFTVNNVIHRFEDLIELRYSNGRIGRSATFRTPSPTYLGHGPFTFEDTRLKFDFDLAGGKPYVGFRLVLPFGN
jgi:hypothetical protein